jgi:putative transposase
MLCCIIPSAAANTPSDQFQRLMADNGVVCSMSRSGNVWDNAAMVSFFSSQNRPQAIGSNAFEALLAATHEARDR